jgi:hypothetical protein
MFLVVQTGPFPTVWDLFVVRLVATDQIQVEQDRELTQEFGPIANTIRQGATSKRSKWQQ